MPRRFDDYEESENAKKQNILIPQKKVEPLHQVHEASNEMQEEEPRPKRMESRPPRREYDDDIPDDQLAWGPKARQMMKDDLEAVKKNPELVKTSKYEYLLRTRIYNDWLDSQEEADGEEYEDEDEDGTPEQAEEELVEPQPQPIQKPRPQQIDSSQMRPSVLQRPQPRPQPQQYQQPQQQIPQQAQPMIVSVSLLENGMLKYEIISGIILGNLGDRLNIG